MFLVATDADLIPVFKPFVELTNGALVADQVLKAAWLVPISPHVILCLLFLFDCDLGNLGHLLLNRWQFVTQLEVLVIEFLLHELFESFFVDYGCPQCLSSLVLATLGDFTTIFDFVANNEVAGLTGDGASDTTTVIADQDLQAVP